MSEKIAYVRAALAALLPCTDGCPGWTIVAGKVQLCDECHASDESGDFELSDDLVSMLPEAREAMGG